MAEDGVDDYRKNVFVDELVVVVVVVDHGLVDSCWERTSKHMATGTDQLLFVTLSSNL